MVSFLTGVGFIIALCFFFLALLCRIIWYFRGLDWRLDRVGYKPNLGQGVKGGAHSIFKWLVPFATLGWRRDPLLCLLTFLLHLGVVVAPLFLVGHAVILYHNFGVNLPTLPMWLTDILTILGLISLVLLAVRRIFIPRVRVLTTFGDWFALILVALPMASGFVAAHAGPEAEGAYIAHLVTGILFLLVAPFSKLSHIVLYFLSRLQIGMDFAIKRGGRKRGAFFPW